MGAKKTFTFVQFSTTSRFNGECHLNETCHRQSAKAIAKHDIVPKFHEPWSTNGLKWNGSFYPDFVSSAFCMLRCEALQIRKQGPTKLCQTQGGIWSWCEPNK